MKAGLITSATLHAIILGWGMFIFTSPMSVDPVEMEALPISLVPLADETSIKKGDKTAEKGEKPAPKKTTKPEIKPDAKHVGDGKVDTAAPLKPQEKPREVQTPPPPSGKPDAQPDMTPPQDKPLEKQPDQGAANATDVKPKAEPEQAKPQEKLEKPATAATIPTDTAEPKAEPIPSLPDSAPVPVAKPTQVAKTTERAPVAKPKQSSTSAKGETMEDILSQAEDVATIDRTRTQGGGAARSNDDQPAYGGNKNIGNGDQLSQNYANYIGGCISTNLRLGQLAGSSTTFSLVAKVHVKLTPDGMISGNPEIQVTGGEATQQPVFYNQVNTALAACSPFKELPRDKYQLWREVIINVKPFND